MKLDKDFREVYDFYAEGSDSKGKILNYVQLYEIVRKVGIDITNDELKTILRTINNSDTENIPFSTFVELFEKKLYKEVSKDAALDAFRLFDKQNTGKISIEDFKHVLNNLCEDLTKPEIEEFLVLADQKKDGMIYYAEFVDFLLK